MRLVHSSGAAVTAEGADLPLIVKAREWWVRMTEGNLEPLTLAAQEGVSVLNVVRMLEHCAPRAAVLDTVLDGQLRAGADSNALLDIRALAPDWVKQERACMLRR